MKTLKRSCVLAVALSALLCAGCDEFDQEKIPPQKKKGDGWRGMKSEVITVERCRYLFVQTWDSISVTPLVVQPAECKGT